MTDRVGGVVFELSLATVHMSLIEGLGLTPCCYHFMYTAFSEPRYPPLVFSFRANERNVVGFGATDKVRGRKNSDFPYLPFRFFWRRKRHRSSLSAQENSHYIVVTTPPLGSLDESCANNEDPLL